MRLFRRRPSRLVARINAYTPVAPPVRLEAIRVNGSVVGWKRAA